MSFFFVRSMNMKNLIILFFLTFPMFGFGQGFQNNKEPKTNIEQAWKYVWIRFYHPKTQLFYDYISSYKKGKELSHLPKAAEVKEQYPNFCGYGTGMEDCMILSGTMLSTIIDKYETTKVISLRTDAANVFKGIKRASYIPEYPGFVARGVCTEDGKSVYYNSSRDQYTHCVYGLWYYYHSSLCNRNQKREIRDIISKIADRMFDNVTPANNYDFLRADGKVCPLGICKMWNVQSHEAARLPMFYAAAWDITGKKKYYNMYKTYIYDAIEQSEKIGDNYSGYVYVQLLYSYDLLYRVEKDAMLRERLKKLMFRVETMALVRANACKEELFSKNETELSLLGPDWRCVKDWNMQKGYRIPTWGEYRKIWSLIREAGESLLVSFMVNNPATETEKEKLLDDIVSYMNYSRISSCGIVFHIAAYWKAQEIKRSIRIN